MSLGADWKKGLVTEQKSQESDRESKRAQKYIARIPDEIAAAQRRGEENILVMELEPSEYNDASFRQPLRRETLAGAAVLVYDYCIEQGLQPRVCGEGVWGNKAPVEMWACPKET